MALFKFTVTFHDGGYSYYYSHNRDAEEVRRVLNALGCGVVSVELKERVV